MTVKLIEMFWGEENSFNQKTISGGKFGKSNVLCLLAYFIFEIIARHDTQHNDMRHDDTQHNRIIYDTQHTRQAAEMTQYNNTLPVC